MPVFLLWKVRTEISSTSDEIKFAGEWCRLARGYNIHPPPQRHRLNPSSDVCSNKNNGRVCGEGLGLCQCMRRLHGEGSGIRGNSISGRLWSTRTAIVEIWVTRTAAHETLSCQTKEKNCRKKSRKVTLNAFILSGISVTALHTLFMLPFYSKEFELFVCDIFVTHE